VLTPKEFSEFAASRRTTRDFLAKPVSQKLIDEIITDAMTAPSWSNTRPFMIGIAVGDKRDRISAGMLKRWKVLAAARNGGILPKLKLAFTPWAWPINDYNMLKAYPKELTVRSRKVGKDLYALLEVPRGDVAARDAHWARNYEFFGAPVEFFIFAHKGLGAYAASDASLFAQNLMLSAHARGLGTCAQGAVAMWSNFVKTEFELPSEYQLLYGIALGYPSDHKVNSFRAERLPISDIIAK
jgi:nitroreductase